jgi:DNA-binding NarL/FixJ family response regulator
LIVVDRRELILGCFSSWLRTFRREFEVMGVCDLESDLKPSEIARSSAVIVGISASPLPDPWLNRQVKWLSDRRADLPIVGITDVTDAEASEALIADLHLRGYIPTSSRLEVAAAGLRLVLAGGWYLPRHGAANRPVTEARPVQTLPDNAVTPLPSLTPRERTVLDLLQQGMANKAIAYRLKLSTSTVKVHVHNIMAKFDVHNRTEAAVVAARVAATQYWPAPTP